MITKRMLAVVGVIGVSAGMLVTAPAQAGSKWGSPQEVSSKFGRALAVSDGGRVAAWIRTNKTSSYSSGPIRTAWYKSAKKGWTPSAAIPGTTESTNVQLSSNGNRALVESGSTGYLMAVRDTGNTWMTAVSVVSGTNLGNGVMAGNGSSLAYIDWGPDDYPTPPGKVYYLSQNADGTWSAPTQIGLANPEARYGYNAELAYSKDGSTIAWVDETYALKAITRNDDGSWSAPSLIKQYGSDPDLRILQLSADGSRVMWVRGDSDGILTSTRTGTTWVPASNVTVDETYSAAMSPNGVNIAWGNTDGQMVVSRYNGTKWVKPKVLGSVGYYPSIALADKTLAWTSSDSKGSSLRSVIWKGGSWQSLVKHSSTGFSPAVSYNGMTLAWASTGNKRIYSVKR